MSSCKRLQRDRATPKVRCGAVRRRTYEKRLQFTIVRVANSDFSRDSARKIRICDADNHKLLSFSVRRRTAPHRTASCVNAPLKLWKSSAFDESITGESIVAPILTNVGLCIRFLRNPDPCRRLSHTHYRALGPELIPVYRQSARR